MNGLDKDQVQLLMNYLDKRIDTLHKRQVRHIQEGNTSASMLNAAMAAEVDSVRAYLEGMMAYILRSRKATPSRRSLNGWFTGASRSCRRRRRSWKPSGTASSENGSV